jgi:pyruvate,orthophosphate dikinase
MPLTDDAWARLHEVRLRGMSQLPEDEQTAALVDAGLVVRRGANTVITAEGRAVHADWARLEAGTEAEGVARSAYQRFAEFDHELKRLTTAWQLAAPSQGNGHTFEQWKLIDRLTTLDERVAPVLRRLGAAVPRLASYRSRLQDALTRLEEGDRHWFSGITCDSYHTVWWQLHEELLLALGIPRSEDPNQ